MQLFSVAIKIAVILLVLSSAAMIVIHKLQTAVPKLDLTGAETRAAKTEVIDTWLETAAKAHKFNGVVLLISGGDVLLEKGYGFTDHTRSKRLTPQSAMRLGDLSKQFTAAGIMALRDQGKLDFDDGLSRHITGFPYADVTVRHLLNNTSGIPDITRPETLSQAFEPPGR